MESAAENDKSRSPGNVPVSGTLFHKGDLVVYPTHGTGRVIDIETKEIAGHKLELLVISFEQDGFMLRVPVARARISGLRKLSPPEEDVRDQGLRSEEFRERQHVKHRRPWGHYRTVDAGDRFQVKHVIVRPGAKLGLRMPYDHSEHWVVLQGTATVQRGEERMIVHENQSVYFPIGTPYRLENPGKLPLALIHVQAGQYLGEEPPSRKPPTFVEEASIVEPPSAPTDAMLAAANAQSQTALNPRVRQVNPSTLLADEDHVQAYYSAWGAGSAAAFIRAARKQAGLTQSQLAEALGTAQSRIAELEGGSAKQGPTIGLLARIAQACGKKLGLVLEN